jgi:hypothetical protein
VVVQDLWVEPLAARDRLQLFNQGVLLLSTLFFLGNANALTPREVQSEFNIAISLMDGNPKEAARILQRLYEFSSTIRIQLELARSLYLSGDLAGAKKEFINILNRPIPITVRDKVEWHLSEIQKRQSAKVYIGLYQDSNPGYVTSARTVSIFGQTLSYQPALTTNSETGLALGLEMEREVIPQSGYFVQANINTATYRTDAFNRQNLDSRFVPVLQNYIPSLSEDVQPLNTPMPNASILTPPVQQFAGLQNGLTPTENALLSPEEQRIRLRQRGLA